MIRVLGVAALVVVLAAAAGWIVWAHAAEPAGHPVAWRDLTASLGPAEFARPLSARFRTRAALADALRRALPDRTPRLPPVDFARDNAVLLAAGPRSSSGYGVRVLSVTDDGDRVVVLAREVTPTLDEPVTARLTYPHRLIVFPRTDKPVTIRWQGRP